VRDGRPVLHTLIRGRHRRGCISTTLCVSSPQRAVCANDSANGEEPELHGGRDYTRPMLDTRRWRDHNPAFMNAMRIGGNSCVSILALRLSVLLLGLGLLLGSTLAAG